MTDLSNYTDFMDRSFDDERRNMVESIKSLLLAKIMAINKTVPELGLCETYIEKVNNWKILETSQPLLSNYEGQASIHRSRSHRGRASLIASKNTFTVASAHMAKEQSNQKFTGTLGR